jgi:hypothetical protein
VKIVSTTIALAALVGVAATAVARVAQPPFEWESSWASVTFPVR